MESSKRPSSLDTETAAVTVVGAGGYPVSPSFREELPLLLNETIPLLIKMASERLESEQPIDPNDAKLQGIYGNLIKSMEELHFISLQTRAGNSSDELAEKFGLSFPKDLDRLRTAYSDIAGIKERIEMHLSKSVSG